MDPGVVAAFYKGKGYTVREGARMPGLSGNEHRVPLLAEGPLGSLAVFFGDAGGVDGPEMGGARKVARDLGATPVLAADSFTGHDRQVAARLGVVLLDGSMLQEDPGPAPAVHPDAVPWPSLQARGAPGPLAGPPPSAPPGTPAGSSSLRVGAEEHPWPASGRTGGRDGPAAAAVDIEELLAETRRPRAREPIPALPPEEREEAMATAAPSAVAAPSPASPPASPSAGGDDAPALWKRPRRTPAPAPAAPAGNGARPGRFAWLGLDAAASAPNAGPARRGGEGFAADYDDVVPARAATADGPDGPAAEPAEARLGEEPGLKETWEEQRRRESRDRLMRRVFWLLFAFAILSFLWLFWNGEIGN